VWSKNRFVYYVTSNTAAEVKTCGENKEYETFGNKRQARKEQDEKHKNSHVRTFIFKLTFLPRTIMAFVVGDITILFNRKF